MGITHEIHWNEPRGYGDITSQVTHGRTPHTFDGKIKYFHGFSYGGIGSLVGYKNTNPDTVAALTEVQNKKRKRRNKNANKETSWPGK